MERDDATAPCGPFQRATEGLSPEDRQRLGLTGFEHGIAPEDPAWILVEFLVKNMNIWKEIKALSEQVTYTAVTINAETVALPQKVAQGGAQAAEKVRKVLIEELEQKSLVIAEVMTKNIREVVGKLPAAAERQKAIILDAWREELAHAAKQERVVQSLSSRILFALLLLVFVALGAGGGYLAEVSFGWLPAMTSPYSVSFEGENILVKGAKRIENCPASEAPSGQICLKVLR